MKSDTSLPQNKYEILLSEIIENPDQLKEIAFQKSLEELTLTEQEKIYLAAIKVQVDSILAIPESKRTYVMYLEVIRQDSEGIELVPKEMRDYNMMFECVSHQTDDSNNFITIIDLPEEMRDFKMCEAIIKKAPHTIKDIYNYNKIAKLTLEEYEKLCLLALSIDPLVIQFFPAYLQTLENFTKAIKGNWRALKFLQQ